jgi:hypothetical protein
VRVRWSGWACADGDPVPFNLKDRDAFHFTIEEYLLAVVSLIDELVRPPGPPFRPETARLTCEA